MNGVLNRLLFALLVLFSGALLLLVVWLVWPYDVTRHDLTPLPLERTTLHAGEAIVYHAKFEKFMNVSGIATVALSNATLTFYPPVVYAGAPGKYDVWNRSFSVPANMPPGKDFFLTFSVEYRVNPVRTIVERYRTENFEVIE